MYSLGIIMLSTNNQHTFASGEELRGCNEINSRNLFISQQPQSVLSFFYLPFPHSSAPSLRLER